MGKLGGLKGNWEACCDFVWKLEFLLEISTFLEILSDLLEMVVKFTFKNDFMV